MDNDNVDASHTLTQNLLMATIEHLEMVKSQLAFALREKEEWRAVLEKTIAHPLLPWSVKQDMARWIREGNVPVAKS